jgi:hypothetical protein
MQRREKDNKNIKDESQVTITNQTMNKATVRDHQWTKEANYYFQEYKIIEKPD